MGGRTAMYFTAQRPEAVRKLVVVDIALSRDQDNPQLIFESMNSTGKELSQADLIRNYVLMGLELILNSANVRVWHNTLINSVAPGNSISYSFVASRPGTFIYESGTDTRLLIVSSRSSAARSRSAIDVTTAGSHRPASSTPNSSPP